MNNDLECPNYEICDNAKYAADGNTKISEHYIDTAFPSYAKYGRCKFCNSIHITTITNIGQEGSDTGITLKQCLICKLVYED